MVRQLNMLHTCRAVGGISDIYHLAGSVSRESEDAREMYALHVEGTRLLCEAAKAEGVKRLSWLRPVARLQ